MGVIENRIGDSLADQFNNMVTACVYEGSKTERELATFIDDLATFNESNGPHAVKLLWITFVDMSCVMCVPNMSVPFIGMVAKINSVDFETGTPGETWTIET